MAKFVGASRLMIEAWAQGFAESLGMRHPERYAKEVAEQIGDQQAPPMIHFSHRDPLVQKRQRSRTVRWQHAKTGHLCDMCGAFIGEGTGYWNVLDEGHFCDDCYQERGA